MSQHRKNPDKPFDLEDRTYEFARQTRLFLKGKKWDPVSWPDVRQLLRSSGSVAGNYIEFTEGISEDDKTYRLRISKKEARESGLWLRLLFDCNEMDPDTEEQLRELLQETDELVRIFASIIHKRIS